MATKDRASSSGVKVLRAMFENGRNASENDAAKGRTTPSIDGVNGEDEKDNAKPFAKVRTEFIAVDDAHRSIANGATQTAGDGSNTQNGTKSDHKLEMQAEGIQQPSFETTSNVGNASSKGALKQSQDQSSYAVPGTEMKGQISTPTKQKMVNNHSKRPATKATPTSKQKQPKTISIAKTRSTTDGPIKPPAANVKSQKSNNVSGNDKTKLRSPRLEHFSNSSGQRTVPSFARSTASNTSKVKNNAAIPTSTGDVVKASRPTQTTRSATGISKPRPRSPTRPTQLPSHLTAATASSAAKRTESTPLELLTGSTRSRRPSTYSVAGERPISHSISTAPAIASLARKPSSTFGPPPRRRADPVSPVTNSKPSNSFLARMMRPTASSASKTHESIEDTASPQRQRIASRLVKSQVASSVKDDNESHKKKRSSITKTDDRKHKVQPVMDQPDARSDRHVDEVEAPQHEKRDRDQAGENEQVISTSEERNDVNGEVEEVVVATDSDSARTGNTSTVIPLDPADETVD